ncbi:MAG: S8 family peptidase [Thermoleophilia bacterium]
MTTPSIRRLSAVVAIAATALPVGQAAAMSARSQQEYIVMMRPGSTHARGRAAIATVGGRVTRQVPMVRGYGARLTATGAARLRHMRGVYAVVKNTRVSSVDSVESTGPGDTTATSYNQSVGSDGLWISPWLATGRGVTVAVIDTGIAGDVVDFRRSPVDPASRVVATVVTNPDATTATDRYGHGTHVAGLIAGNGYDRPVTDPLFGKYIGAAPEADLVSVKASDDHGNATVLDVINGLQFVVDHKADYKIRVVNLSLESSAPQSARIDPLDAAVEQAWLHGLVVVAAAGNRGSSSDAVTYAPGNDPYAISVGGVDDKSTKATIDDELATWSSRGVTQDGYRKPEVIAPGAHMVSVLAPGSDFATLCNSCVVGGSYIRLGGTSMSAAVASGVVADLLQAHPAWTPDQVKAALVGTTRNVRNVGPEIAALAAMKADLTKLPKANLGLVPNSLINPATGNIDWLRASWSRASWSTASDPLRASWSRASWSCSCLVQSTTTMTTSRASWSRASWSSNWDK